METETNRHPVTVEGARALGSAQIYVVRLPNGDHGAHIAHTITRDELQAIVQQAYDDHGILAVPSIALEAERVTQAAVQRGLCPCTSSGCSDRASKVYLQDPVYLAAQERESADVSAAQAAGVL